VQEMVELEAENFSIENCKLRFSDCSGYLGMFRAEVGEEEKNECLVEFTVQFTVFTE
jgi:hypothetical protein